MNAEVPKNESVDGSAESGLIVTHTGLWGGKSIPAYGNFLLTKSVAKFNSQAAIAVSRSCQQIKLIGK